MIDWTKTSKEDDAIIRKIADRAASELGAEHKQDIEMDITAAHIANPLDLNLLLYADDFNFYHDICGINRHIDRDSGNMLNHFLPRFQKKAQV